MKKLLALLLCLAMVFTFAACGSTTTDDAADETATEASWQDELGTQGLLRVGMAADYPPFESFDADGNVVGFDADMAQLIADKLGLELEIVRMDFETIVSAVAAGTVDVGISCFSYTDERAESVLFTDTYMTSSQACFGSTQYGINTMEDLAGGLVGAGNGTTGMDVAKELAEVYGYETSVGEIAVMAEALNAGAMQGVITEQCVAESYINENPGEFQMIAEDLTVEEIKAITNLNAPNLNAAINGAINEIQADEESYDALIVSWFDMNLED